MPRTVSYYTVENMLFQVAHFIRNKLTAFLMDSDNSLEIWVVTVKVVPSKVELRDLQYIWLNSIVIFIRMSADIKTKSADVISKMTLELSQLDVKMNGL